MKLIAQLIFLAIAAAPFAAQAKFLPALDLPPDPTSDLAKQHRHFSAEAEAYRSRENARAATASAYQAADFAGLAAGPWRVLHQDVTLDFQPLKSTVVSTIAATVVAKEPKLTSLQFIVSNSDSITAKFADAQVSATISDAGQGYGLLTIDLPQAMTVDTQNVLTIQRTAKLDCKPGFLGFLPCSTGENFWWMTQNFMLRAYTNDHAPYSADLHIYTSAKQVAATPGQPTGVDTLADGRKLWHFSQVEQTEQYAFAIAEYNILESKANDAPVPLRIYGLNKDQLPNMLALVKEAVAFFGERYLPIAWKTLNLIQVEYDFGGGQSFPSGILVIAGEYAAAPDNGLWYSASSLISHEIAHQWWGNLVAPNSTGDVALSESLAEFSSCWYTEIQLKTRNQIVTNNLDYVYQVSAAQDKPLGNSGVYNSPKYVDIVYHKGSVVMDMLRKELGDEVWSKALKAFRTSFSRDYAKISDLRAAAEKASGRDLGWFFSQWFQKAGSIHAELTGRSQQNPDKSWAVSLRVAQPDGPPRRFRLNFTVDTAGGKSVDFVKDVIPTAQNEPIVFNVDVPSAPLRVRCDVGRTLLRQFSGATPGDVNLSGLVDGADLVDMAFRYGHGVSLTNKQGQQVFYADASWNELYDLTGDYRVNVADVEFLQQWLGTTADPF